eukprot:6092599-Pleurochrysis_carterae.AAC.1
MKFSKRLRSGHTSESLHNITSAAVLLRNLRFLVLQLRAFIFFPIPKRHGVNSSFAAVSEISLRKSTTDARPSQPCERFLDVVMQNLSYPEAFTCLRL